MDNCIKPPALQPGDRVRLVSPSSYPDQHWLEESIEVLKGWGFRPEVGRHAMNQHGPMAGTDQERLADLHDAFNDSGVRAVITTRGGMGAYRIADHLDFDALRYDPKPIVGFSDITNIHLAVWRHCRQSTIHGCLAGVNAQASVLGLLTEPATRTVHRNPRALTAAITTAGRARGVLLGGNLRELAGSVGTGGPTFDGAIVLLEDLRHIGIGQVDRNLTQLFRSGMFSRAAGVVIGLFDEFAGYVDRDWSVLDILHAHFDRLDIPVLGGLDIGHGGTGADGGPDQHAVTLGAMAEIDVDAGTLTVGPCVR